MRVAWWVLLPVAACGCQGAIDGAHRNAPEDDAEDDASPDAPSPFDDENTPAADGAAATDDASLGIEGDDDAGIPLVDAEAPTSLPGFELLLREADRELRIMRVSTYSHTTHVDEATGTFDYDCSGFVDYALVHAPLPRAYADLQKDTVRRPVASSYVTFFENVAHTPIPTWAAVPRVQDLVAGDIVAWLEPSDVASTNTGHVMIVHAAPVKLKGALRAPATDAGGLDGGSSSGDGGIQDAGSSLRDGGAADASSSTEDGGARDASPIEAGITGDDYEVSVVDSAISSHGTRDTRSPGRGGLGSGSIVLIADRITGAPLGYRWYPETLTQHVTKIRLGHVN
jgi:hypothetical protein